MPNYLNLEEIAARFAKTHRHLRLHPVLRSDDTTLTYQAVRADMGVAFLPEWLIADDLAAGRLVTVEEDEAASMRTTLFAVYTSRQYMAPKLRTFIDFLSVALAS